MIHNTPHPFAVFSEIAGGILTPGVTSDLQKMILRFNPGEPATDHGSDLSAYHAAMEPVYDKLSLHLAAKHAGQPAYVHRAFMNRKVPVTGPGDSRLTPDSGSAVLSKSPKSPASTSLSKHSPPPSFSHAHSDSQASDTPDSSGSDLRLVDYSYSGKGTETERIYRAIIRSEGLRARAVIGNILKENGNDSGLRAYELGEVHQFLAGLSDKAAAQITAECSPASRPIFTLLSLELRSLLSEIELVHPVATAVKEPAGMHNLPNPLPLYRTLTYYREKLHEILKGWKLQKHNPTPVAETALLLDNILSDSGAAPPRALAGIAAQAETALLLMILKRVEKVTKKKELMSADGAKKQLGLLDTLIRFGGESKEETRLLFEYADRLDEAELKFGTDRFDGIRNRHEQIDSAVEGAFRMRPGEEAESDSIPGTGRLPTALERVRNEFLTVEQLAELHEGVDPNSIRRIIRDKGIRAEKRGAMLFVHVEDYFRNVDG